MEPLRVMVLVTALPLNELYNCVKFKVDSINSFRDMLPTKFVTDGRQRSDPYNVYVAATLYQATQKCIQEGHHGP